MIQIPAVSSSCQALLLEIEVIKIASPAQTGIHSISDEKYMIVALGAEERCLPPGGWRKLLEEVTPKA